MLNNPADILSIVLGGTLGRSGRKRARRAAKFLSGNRGILTAGTLMTAAGVLWGIYDSAKGQNVPVPPAGGGAPAVPPIPVPAEPLPDPMLRVIRLAVSAARADGDLSAKEREIILSRAKEAGLESTVEPELTAPRALADIVRGVTDPEVKKELYVIAFTIIRADESVSGAERVYLAQLAHQLGLDPATVAALETETAAKIDAQDDSSQ